MTQIIPQKAQAALLIASGTGVPVSASAFNGRPLYLDTSTNRVYFIRNATIYEAGKPVAPVNPQPTVQRLLASGTSVRQGSGDDEPGYVSTRGPVYLEAQGDGVTLDVVGPRCTRTRQGTPCRHAAQGGARIRYKLDSGVATLLDLLEESKATVPDGPDLRIYVEGGLNDYAKRPDEENASDLLYVMRQWRASYPLAKICMEGPGSSTWLPPSAIAAYEEAKATWRAENPLNFSTNLYAITHTKDDFTDGTHLSFSGAVKDGKEIWRQSKQFMFGVGSTNPNPGNNSVKTVAESLPIVQDIFSRYVRWYPGGSPTSAAMNAWAEFASASFFNGTAIYEVAWENLRKAIIADARTWDATIPVDGWPQGTTPVDPPAPVGATNSVDRIIQDMTSWSDGTDNGAKNPLYIPRQNFLIGCCSLPASQPPAFTVMGTWPYFQNVAQYIKDGGTWSGFRNIRWDYLFLFTLFFEGLENASNNVGVAMRRIKLMARRRADKVWVPVFSGRDYHWFTASPVQLAYSDPQGRIDTRVNAANQQELRLWQRGKGGGDNVYHASMGSQLGGATSNGSFKATSLMGPAPAAGGTPTAPLIDALWGSCETKLVPWDPSQPLGIARWFAYTGGDWYPTDQTGPYNGNPGQYPYFDAPAVGSGRMTLLTTDWAPTQFATIREARSDAIDKNLGTITSADFRANPPTAAQIAS